MGVAYVRGLQGDDPPGVAARATSNLIESYGRGRPYLQMNRLLIPTHARNIKVKECLRIGIHADLRIGSAWPRARESFVVDGDMHRLHWTKFGIDDVRDCHGIEQRGRFLPPFVVEQRQRVRERRASLE